VRILVAIFFNARFAIGDDAQEECQLIADCFGRTPGSVDRQWRNISAVCHRAKDVHIGRLISDCVREYLDDPAVSSQLAVGVLERRGWPLHELLERGEDSSAFTEITDMHLAEELRRRIRPLVDQIDYHIFPSGSHGFAVDVVSSESSPPLRVRVSCVLAESGREGTVRPVSTREDVATSVGRLIQQVSVKTSKLGRLWIIYSGRTIIDQDRFNVVIRVNQLLERNA
jgi:hypothetical protein